MQKGIFITATSTGIGKTITSSLILSALHAQNTACGYFKPVQTGTDLDTPIVRELTTTSIRLSKMHGSTLPIAFASSVYSFAMPAAPSRAAEAEGKTIKLKSIQATWQHLDPNVFWIVEGAGGLLVPLNRIGNRTETIRDLVSALNLKMLIIASTQLGTINHTLLTVEAAQKMGIKIPGIILVGDKDPGQDRCITQYSGVPIIAQIPHFSNISSDCIAEMGNRYFSKEILEKIKEV